MAFGFVTAVSDIVNKLRTGRDAREFVNPTIRPPTPEEFLNNQLQDYFGRNNGAVNVTQSGQKLSHDLFQSTPSSSITPIQQSGGRGASFPAAVPGAFTHPFQVSFVEGNAVVNALSFLCISLDPFDVLSISGLGSPLGVSAGDDIWLNVTVGTDLFPTGASIQTGSFPGPIEDDSGSPPAQTNANLLIAQVVSDGGTGLAVIQFAFTHFRMRVFVDTFLAVNYPMPM